MRESGQECPYEGEDCSLTDCDERDHTCGCGECCDACWFDCCASPEGMEAELDMMEDFEEPLTNCGFVPLKQMDFLINEWIEKAKKGRHDRTELR